MEPEEPTTVTPVAGTHPTADQLTAFELGRLSSAQWSAVAAHLAGCAQCGASRTDTPEDPFVRLLRRCAVPPAANGAGPTTSAPALPPELADHPRYRVRRLLGSGGMGAVYEAEHRLMNRRVALKVIRRDLTDRPAVVEQFRREVEAAARLAHPNIVTAHDAEQAGHTHFLVMEYVEGESLDRLVERQGPLPVGRACEYVRQAALGLQHAHEQGMVHRDLKPANLMLTPEGRVKVLDFGLARLAREGGAGGSLPHAGAVLGTPDYMAPEQARQPAQADIRADLYSLGCTLYHLLTGRPPFAGGAALEKLLAHQDRQAPSVTAMRPDVPPAFAGIIARLLAKDPAARFQTPAEVADALAPFADPDAARAPRAGDPAEAGPVVGSARPRRRWLLVATALVAAGLLTLAVVYVVTDRGTLVVESDSPDVELTVRQGGRVVRVLDGRSGQAVTLRPGDYDVDLTGGPKGLTLRTDHFTLLRGGQQVVEVHWQRAAGELRCVRDGDGTFTAATISGDGSRALAAAPDNSLRLWDLDAGRELARLRGHTATVTSVCFSPDCLLALSGSEDRTVRVWDLVKRRLLKTLPARSAAVQSVCFLPDGRTALSGGDDRRMVLWDVVAGRSVQEFRDPDEAVTCVVASSSGWLGLAGDRHGGVRIWDVSRRKTQPGRVYRAHGEGLYGAALSRDERYALTGGGDGTVRFWRLRVAVMEVRHFAGHNGAVRAVALRGDNRLAVSGGADGGVRLWDLEAGRQVAQWDGHTDAVLAVAFRPDGRRAWSAARDGTFRLWDLPPVRDRGRKLLGHEDAVLAVALTPDGKTLVSGGSDRTVRVWDVATGKERRTFRGHRAAVWSVAVTADGKLVASGSDDHTVRVWDVAANQERAVLVGHTGEVRVVRFTADGRTLASSGWDDTVRLWDVARGRTRLLLHSATGPVLSLAMTPDGRLVAGSSRGLDDEDHAVPAKVTLWDTATGERGAAFEVHFGPVYGLAFTADGKTLATSGSDGTVKLWDVATHALRTSWRAHLNQVEALAITPDGRRLATGGADKTVKVWDATGQELVTLRNHLEPVKKLAFSVDGKTLASASEDGTIRVWDVPREVASGD